ncbi:hypothetical protein D0856_05360 [Vibrio owensii]|nr:hypothetical protein D0856_05360 [Vibrio owensii]
MFTLLGIIILLVIALALLMNYFLCRDFIVVGKSMLVQIGKYRVNLVLTNFIRISLVYFAQ